MKKRIVVSILAGLMLATSVVAAEETLPLNAVNRANEVIDAALEAYGGAESHHQPEQRGAQESFHYLGHQPEPITRSAMG